MHTPDTAAPLPLDPELVRQLLGQQPAQSEHSADAI